jgi:hypothetical protein
VKIPNDEDIQGTGETCFPLRIQEDKQAPRLSSPRAEAWKTTVTTMGGILHSQSDLHGTSVKEDK